MIEIDGSEGEGGGQILRTAIGLAGALREDVRIINIRAGRSEPGLRAQHLAGILAAARICDAEVSGAAVGSTSIVFQPRRLVAGSFKFDVGTAGSISLVLQTLMPLCMFLPGSVVIEITGGTDVKWSPPIDYLSLVVLPILRAMKFSARLELLKRGYYPKGGGLVSFRAIPAHGFSSIRAPPLSPVGTVRAISHARGLRGDVARRQADSAQRILREKGITVEEVVLDEGQHSQSVGSGISLCASRLNGDLLGGDSLGERGKPAERVGESAALRLVEEIESGSFLDRHMADMVVPYMALANGVSEVTVSKITKHCLTNVRVTEQLAGVRFEVIGNLNENGSLRTRGLGLRVHEAVSSSTKHATRQGL